MSQFSVRDKGTGLSQEHEAWTVAICERTQHPAGSALFFKQRGQLKGP
jgi:hypothetical protein